MRDRVTVPVPIGRVEKCHADRAHNNSLLTLNVAQPLRNVTSLGLDHIFTQLAVH